MTSRTTITDMQDLLDLLQLDPQTPRPLSHALTDDQIERLRDWVATAIRVRRAQKSRSKTPQHEDMMIAYWAAVAQWSKALEHETVMHKTEVADFQAEHPMPTLRAFMKASRRPMNFCPLCGSDLATVDAIASDVVV